MSNSENACIVLGYCIVAFTAFIAGSRDDPDDSVPAVIIGVIMFVISLIGAFS